LRHLAHILSIRPERIFLQSPQWAPSLQSPERNYCPARRTKSAITPTKDTLCRSDPLDEMLLSRSSLLVLSAGNALVAGAGAVTTTATTTVGTSCFFRNGSIAIGHRPCPGQSNICCNTTDTCTTNGLCKSHENHWPDTRLTPWINDPVTGAPSYANFTFLYQTSTCTNADYSGCSTQCTNRRSKKYPCNHHHPSSIIHHPSSFAFLS
jgi:hypothetical protein